MAHSSRECIGLMPGTSDFHALTYLEKKIKTRFNFRVTGQQDTIYEPGR